MNPKRGHPILGSVIAGLILAATVLHADPPTLMRYQARLTDAAGVPIVGPITATFGIYAVETGGTPVWSEIHALTPQSGSVDVVLGQTSPLTSAIVNAPDRWLEVTVDDGSGAKVLGPRQRLASVPFALVSDRLGTKTLAEVETEIDNRIATHAAAATAHPVTLDTAYDGGPAITADSGPVVIVGPDGLELDGGGGLSIIEGGGMDVSGITLLRGIVDVRGTLVAGALDAGWVVNLGVTLSGGTLRITDASGSSLDLNNWGHVTVSSTTPGQLAALKVVTSHSFNDNNNAASDLTNLGFGITEAADWSEDMPFFLYVVNRNNTDLLGSDGNSAFFLARSFAMHTTPSNVNDIGDTNSPSINDSQDVILLLGSYTPSNYASLPCQLVGAIRMRWSGLDSDWTVRPLGNADGMGKTQLAKTFGTNWTFPPGQNGAVPNSYLKLNGGTSVPVFSGQSIEYTIYPTGEFRVYVSLFGDGGVDGSGAVNTLLAVPYHIRNLRFVELGWWIRIALVDRPGGFDFTTHTNFLNINAFRVGSGDQLDATLDSVQLNEWSSGDSRIYGSSVFEAYL